MLTEPREAPRRTSTFELTPGRPGRIDLTTEYEGVQLLLQTQGLITLTGDALTYCVAGPGQPRPAALATAKGDGHTLVVLKRAR